MRSALLAGRLLEAAGAAKPGTGVDLAQQTLQDGRAWAKFQAICEAQGGMRTPPTAAHKIEVNSTRSGIVRTIDNRRLAKVAKLAGAPGAPAAGLEFLAPLGDRVERGDALFVLHAETPGELRYALEYVERNRDIIELD